LAEAEGGPPQVILIASGSEVAIALEARERLAADGVHARVVSMPSWALFERQPRSYRNEVLPPEVHARLGVEAAEAMGWEQWVGERGDAIGMLHFGQSAPARELFHQHGFTAENVAERAKALLGRPARTNGRPVVGPEGAGPARLGVDETAAEGAG
ncbi:MAG: transketolase-like TK C-terminal-containing protein, partial [Gemmatimonadota bacterium]